MLNYMAKIKINKCTLNNSQDKTIAYLRLKISHNTTYRLNNLKKIIKPKKGHSYTVKFKIMELDHRCREMRKKKIMLRMVNSNIKLKLKFKITKVQVKKSI